MLNTFDRSNTPQHPSPYGLIDDVKRADYDGVPTA